MAIDVKRSSTPRPERGFLLLCEEVGAAERFLVIAGGEEHPIGHGTEAMPLATMLGTLSELWAA